VDELSARRSSRKEGRGIPSSFAAREREKCMELNEY